MKLYEAITRLDKVNNSTWIDTNEIGHEFDMYDIPYAEQERLEGFYLSSWLCTDTIVGDIIYFFDDVPVAISSQLGRKYDKVFKWFSLEKAQQVKDYLISLRDDENELNVLVIDTMDYEIHEGYGIEFNGNLLELEGRKAYYKNEDVIILERIKNKEWGIDTNLKIERKGEILIVDINDLIFPYHLENI